MSISDRLDEIEQRCADSWSGPWSWELDDEDRITLHAGGSVPFDLIRRDEFRGPSEVAEFISHARTDVPDLLAALRAVLDVCEGLEEAHRANPTQMYEYGMEEAAHQVRNAIAVAFGCGDGIDTSPERVHETPNREHVGEET